MKNTLKRRAFSLALTAVMLVALFPTVAHAANGFGDTSGHWAENVIEKWAGFEVLTGYPDGNFKPEESITRGEFATILNRLMRYQTVAKNSFSDLDSGAGYADAMLRLVSAGVMNGNSDGTISPLADISREQAIAMLSRAFHVTGNAAASGRFTDSASISSWAVGEVGGMADKGYISGNPDGSLNPLGSLKRAEAVKIIDNIIKGYYSAAGVYSDGTISGVAVVNAPGVDLRNMRIGGDLYVAPGVAEGEFTLRGSTVAGNAYIDGGGANSVKIIGSIIDGTMIIGKDGDTVRIYVDQDSDVKIISLTDGSSGAILHGTVGTIIAGASLNLAPGSRVDNITVTEGGVSITGPQGSVGTAVIDKDAGPGVSVTTPGAKVVNNSNYPVSVGDGKFIAPGETGFVPTPWSSGSVSSGSTVSVSAVKIDTDNTFTEAVTITASGSKYYVLPGSVSEAHVQVTLQVSGIPDGTEVTSLMFTDNTSSTSDIVSSLSTPAKTVTNGKITIPLEFDGGAMSTGTYSYELTVGTATCSFSFEVPVSAAYDAALDGTTVWYAGSDDNILSVYETNDAIVGVVVTDSDHIDTTLYKGTLTLLNDFIFGTNDTLTIDVGATLDAGMYILQFVDNAMLHVRGVLAACDSGMRTSDDGKVIIYAGAEYYQDISSPLAILGTDPATSLVVLSPNATLTVQGESGQNSGVGYTYTLSGIATVQDQTAASVAYILFEKDTIIFKDGAQLRGVPNAQTYLVTGATMKFANPDDNNFYTTGGSKITLNNSEYVQQGSGQSFVWYTNAAGSGSPGWAPPLPT